LTRSPCRDDDTIGCCYDASKLCSTLEGTGDGSFGWRAVLPAPDITPIAGFWRRLTAFVIDCLILSVPTLLLGLALFRWVAGLGPTGRLIGFVVALLYFGVLNSHFGGGQTLGKRLLGIRVIDRSGKLLSPIR
jgi:hypothetical protein